MKLRSIRAIQVDTRPRPVTKPRPRKAPSRQTARPSHRYAAFRDAGSWGMPASWRRPFVIAEAEDGTRGYGITLHGAPVVSIINDHFAPNLAGLDVMSVETLWDMMIRMAVPYGGGGLASHAVSAVDLALWDLKGKLLGRPVYELLGGPQKDRIFCYATGFDTQWYMELGFRATKLFSIAAAEEGVEGLSKNEDTIAEAREACPENTELMLDCWMSADVEYVARLAERLRPYDLKWIEEYLLPDDWEGYAAVRSRLPWQTLASGEHWYFAGAFATAAARRLVDIFQPDLLWCGGLTAALKICSIAESAGIAVIPHASANYPFGQHLAFASAAVKWGERSEGVSPPGVPLEEMTQLPGTPCIKDGFVIPSDAPGFGLEIDDAWIESHIVK